MSIDVFHGYHGYHGNLHTTGWGEWGGMGVETKKRKKRKRITEETDDIIKEEVPRKDANLKFVIINHTKDTKASKHLVNILDHYNGVFVILPDPTTNI